METEIVLSIWKLLDHEKWVFHIRTELNLCLLVTLLEQLLG